MIWIEALLHQAFKNNTSHETFNATLNEVVQLQPNTFTLSLKKIWDPENRNFYLSEQDRFTAEGLSAYWSTINATLKFADTLLWKKLQSKPSKDKGNISQKSRTVLPEREPRRECSKRSQSRDNSSPIQHRSRWDRFHWNQPSDRNLQREFKDSPFTSKLPTPPPRCY